VTNFSATPFARHRAPFVNGRLEPDLKQVFGTAVFRDVARRDVAVIVENRLGLGEFVVSLRAVLVLTEIFVDEWHRFRRLKSAVGRF